MSDRLFGGVGLALAAFYIWAATTIPDSFMTDAIGPRTFPIIIGVMMALCSIYFLLRPDAEPAWPGVAGLLEVVCAFAVMMLYAVLLQEVGFLISTVFATAYLTWRLGSAPLNSLVTGVATSVGIYVVFKLILGLSLARGPMGF